MHYPQAEVSRAAAALRAVPLWVYVVALFLLLVLLAPSATVVGGDGDVDRVPAVDLEAVQRSFEEVVARVTPSVVAIRVERRYVAVFPPAEGGAEPAGLEQLVIVNGSGTIIGSDGLILTNEHVIQSASRIELLFSDGQRLPATVVASDPRSDLAVLRVERQQLSAAKVCHWAEVARSQWAITLGNPYGLGSDGNLSVSIGVISNLGRRLPGLGEVDDRLYHNMIQTTAAINPGNSGGPLFNIRGEMIGVVTAMHTRAAADEGVGFAIPLTPSKLRIIERLSRGEAVEYGYLGVTVGTPSANERRSAGLDADVGVIVQVVEPDGPAALAGVCAGDLIVRFAEQVVRNPGHLAERLGEVPVGVRIPVELRRDGKRLVTMTSVERREVSHVSWMRGGALLWRGMRLANLTSDARQRMSAGAETEGVVVIDVAGDGPAQRAGIRIGDVIEQVAGQSVHDTYSVRQTVGKCHGSVEVVVRQRGACTLAP
ncbi:MAG: trypsin-like peptidase domain-containing protein [Planctomycetes bacterium]|nr:trypsin-like peptidase domain-containing protein [Planctomycetota bacterium]